MNNANVFTEWLAIWDFFESLRRSNPSRLHRDHDLERFSTLFTDSIADSIIGTALTEVFEGRQDVSDEPHNLYPSDVKGECKDLAVFVALDSKAIGLKRKHAVSFREVIPVIVQHVQGHCPKTRGVLLLTSTWNQDEIEPWLNNIRQFQLERFDIFLRIGDRWTVIDGLKI